MNLIPAHLSTVLFSVASSGLWLKLSVSVFGVPLNRPSLLSCEVHLLGLSLLQPKGSFFAAGPLLLCGASCLSFVGEISFRSFFDFY